MGNRASRPTEDDAKAESVKAMESRFSSIGLLSDLRAVFSRASSSASPVTTTIDRPLLKGFFELKAEWPEPKISDLLLLQQNVASAIIDTIFVTGGDGISWESFLKGIEKCHRPNISGNLKLLLCFLCHLQNRAALPTTCSFSADDLNQPDDLSFSGHINVSMLRDFLWLSWLMWRDSDTRSVKFLGHELPDVQPLVRSALKACVLVDDQLPIEKVYKWMLALVPGLSLSLTSYVQARLHKEASKYKKHEAEASKLEVGQVAPCESTSLTTQSISRHRLLTSGVAWATGLSHPDQIGKTLVSYSFHVQEVMVHLLYRASLHGKGMNRFWVSVEGYQGAALFLIQGSTSEETTAKSSEKKTWLVGAFIKDGFESKLGYYGSKGCCIYALDPLMQVFRSTGTASNFLHTSPASSNKTYFGQTKKITGIGFGGEVGKERLWIDEDFTSVTVRHHAVDKTYEYGHLLPEQGYGTVEGKVLEVEVWGMGGTEVREKQAKLQERKNLFVEQKRKVDLANWVDSPEKRMMDMVSDPMKLQREER